MESAYWMSRQRTDRQASNPDRILKSLPLSKDGRHIYIFKRRYKIRDGHRHCLRELEHIIPVGLEPERRQHHAGRQAVLRHLRSRRRHLCGWTDSYSAVGISSERTARSVAFLSRRYRIQFPRNPQAELNVIDTVNAKVMKTIALPQAPGDERQAYRPTKNGCTQQWTCRTVSVLDSHSYELLDTIKVGTRPWGIALSLTVNFFFRQGPSNDVSVVDLRTNKRSKRIKAGSSPWGIGRHFPIMNTCCS